MNNKDEAQARKPDHLEGINPNIVEERQPLQQQQHQQQQQGMYPTFTLQQPNPPAFSGAYGQTSANPGIPTSAYAPPPPNTELPGPAYAPPPPQNMQPFNGVQMYQPTTVPMVVGTPLNIQMGPRLIRYGRHPQRVTCPFCHTDAMTMVRYDLGNGTYIVSGAIFLFGFWLGCCLIPCCLDDCKDATHVCSNCGNVIGQSRFLFD
eukprot:TRINITY_DN6493_c0_g1_i1.p1 TRINITY_DN6493_c0_g1~~TRINITY_DN6493_c0_g1_i1.p1  ORF type:complete len:205 (+),score=23.04 TRINITY_DN6493_c0_g1_i1:103-717(+)